MQETGPLGVSPFRYGLSGQFTRLHPVGETRSNNWKTSTLVSNLKISNGLVSAFSYLSLHRSQVEKVRKKALSRRCVNKWIEMKMKMML
jgi:adenylylsulfate kinase-like enzyme